MATFQLKISTNFNKKTDHLIKPSLKPTPDSKATPTTSPQPQESLRCDLEFVINGQNQSLSNKIETKEGGKYTITLLDYDLKKKVYSPCEMKVSLQFACAATAENCQNIIKGLKGVRVDLTSSKDDENFVDNVAINYFVYAVKPRITKAAGTQYIYVDLEVYSKDKQIALEKGCQAFTAKKFISEIFLANNDAMVDVKANKNSFPQCLTMRVVKTPKKGLLGAYLEDREVIQPYLVQYNETYYNFLARTANRCGEFMYFEDGLLTIGLKYRFGELESIPLDDYNSIEFKSLDTPPDTYKPFYQDNMLDENEVGKYADRLSCKQEVPTDEYLFTIEKGEWTDFKAEYAEHVDRKIVGLIPYILSNESISEMIGDLVMDETFEAIDAKIEAVRQNKLKDNDYFRPTREEQRNGDEAYPFTTYFPEDEREYIALPALPTKEFYSMILEFEKEVSQDAIDVDLGNAYQHLLLGDIVNVDGVEYIVIEVKAQCSLSTGTNEKYSITAIKLKTISDEESDEEETHKYAFPPVYEGGHICRSGIQRAYVVDGWDPQWNGRVRIRYPWQAYKKEWNITGDDAKKDGVEGDYEVATASPWIRLSSDFSSKRGGIFFRPLKGTEVLVDYEDGNVERPYIVGSLYNVKECGPYDKTVIRSEHGHSIVFNNPLDGGKFVSGLWGGWGFMTKYIPGMLEISKKMMSDLKPLTGGIEMSDRYGMYNISMSSDKRAIDIDSPFGNVSINAFTGISITAPNGDIKISGKNVTIEAGNDLKLVSGKNIDNGADDNIFTNPSGKTVGTFFKDMAKEAFYENLLKNRLIKPFVDLKLLRSLYEAFIKPVQGTLTVKSFRYLLMEAGDGKTQIPFRAYKNKKNASEDAIKVGALHIAFNNKIRDARDMELKCVGLYDAVKNARRNLQNEMVNNCFSDDALSIPLTPQEVKSKLDAVVDGGKDVGKFAQNHKPDLDQKIEVLHAAVEEFKKCKDDFLTKCTTYDKAQKFTQDSISVKQNGETKEFIQDQLKKLIKDSDVIEGDETKTDWGDYVESIKMKEKKTTAGSLLKDFGKDVAKLALGVGSVEEFKNVLNPYIWNEDSTGEILMSSEEGHTLSFEHGQLRHKINLTPEGTIFALKGFLNRQ